MGVYLNPGKTAYEMAINSEVFVDKTEMIQHLNSVVNTSRRYISVSRPRRFGKTMAAEMICAYYDREADSRALFEKRKLSKMEPLKAKNREIRWDMYLGQFDVIRVVMTRYFKRNSDVQEALASMQRRIIRDIKKSLPEGRLL